MPNYNMISNDPYRRSKVTNSWIYWDDAFTGEEIQSIIDYCDSKEMSSGVTVGAASESDIKAVRISDVSFHTRDANTAWIFDRLNFVLNRVNEDYYNFDLNGYSQIQYTKYRAEENAKYDWHMDTILDHNNISEGLLETRKLSLTLNLNDDYEGGEFELNLGSESRSVVKVPSKKGRAIIFPSFLIHRVKPVTSGIRKSLVVWVVGPKFR